MAIPSKRNNTRATPERVLDVAERLFAERGFAGASLADICGEVGIAKSSLLHHFPSKKRIYAGVLARIVGDLEAMLAEARQMDGEPAARFRHMIALHLHWTRRRPDYNQLMLRELIDNAGRASQVRHWVLKPVLDELAGLVAEAQGKGAMGAVDPMLFLFHTVGGIAYVMAARLTLAGITGETDIDAMVERYCDFVIQSIDAALMGGGR
jgi:TetR/AcrR family transcriptional regulator